MLDPMLARLVGCVVFASLLGGLLVVALKPYGETTREAVQVAELQKSVEKVLFTRP